MSLLDRYIFRIACVAFLATVLSLTGVIWITQALREVDLVTGKGQTIFTFLTVTSLSLPALVAIIAPVALFIAVVYALNKLNGDSELIVMSAAGAPPGRIMRPLLILTVIVTLLVGVMTTWAMPASFRALRDLITSVRADFVTNIVKEGQFTTLDLGITFHYRERAGDALLGIFMQDRRDKTKPAVYIAERGQTLDINGSPYLVLEQGSVQREQPGSADPAIVVFQRYAIDLSQFGADGETPTYKPRERSTWALLNPNVSEAYYQMPGTAGRFRTELHDRFSGPLYCLAMMAIAFAALGTPRTTRQGRGAAIGAAIVTVGLLRIAGFAASSLIARSPWAAPLAYVIPALGFLGGLAATFGPELRLGRRGRGFSRPAAAAATAS
ncbi:LPS export ABC transporter permease LptF [Alsobacter metallidurans]|uniref:LPS export ABC transporter permease LptF n=1 Tax=Alsobacter metallidurans TaxID=340221 RepID=A0A917I7M8_9HYPH|nr:LPS export ABC transporter permease LptF [Alsobacter metallidurans]GGH21581.1 LPS export ABC transporter permease LptF [Alsobacter metallidurans]